MKSQNKKQKQRQAADISARKFFRLIVLLRSDVALH